MSDWGGFGVIVMVLVGWYVLQSVVLPRLGVPT
jgi:hypothetical protein